jgi:hypothetical protein
LKLQSRDLEIGIKKKSLGVMNGQLFCNKDAETQSFLGFVPGFICLLLCVCAVYKRALSIIVIRAISEDKYLS